MKNIIKMITFFLCSFALWAQTDPGNPDWCLDLGISGKGPNNQEISRCFIDPHSKSGSDILTLLANTDPKKFLPEELAQHVERCRKLKIEKHPLYGYVCRTIAPLSGPSLADITFIPADRLEEAKLSSGARVIVDCNGRHLQIRADLPPEKQFELIKNAYGAMLLEATTKRLSEKLSKTKGSSLYETCDLTGQKNTVKSFSVDWVSSKTTYIVSLNELAAIPEAYVPPGCLPDQKFGFSSKSSGQSSIDPKIQELMNKHKKMIQLNDEFLRHNCCYDFGTMGMGGMGGMSGNCNNNDTCKEISESMTKESPRVSGTPEQNKTALLQLAKEAKPGSKERINFLTQAKFSGGFSSEFSGDYPADTKLDDEIKKETIPYCKSNPCECFTFGKWNGVTAFGISELLDTCQNAPLDKCNNQSWGIPDQKLHCNSIANPQPMGGYGGYGSSFSEGLNLNEPCVDCAY